MAGVTELLRRVSTTAVYEGDAYRADGLPDTSNERDGIAGDPEAEGTLLHLRAAETSGGAGTLALLDLQVEASADGSGGRP